MTYSTAYGGTLYHAGRGIDFDKLGKRELRIPKTPETAGLYEYFMQEWKKTPQYARFMEQQRVKSEAIKDNKTARAAEAARVKSEHPSCGVCFEDCNLSNRSTVRCPYCPLVICRSCAVSYILQTAECRNIGCPECRTGWSEEFLDENMTAKFLLGEFKEGYSKILVDQERARLPEAQEEAARYKDAARIAKRFSDEIAAIKARIDTHPLKITYEVTRDEYHRARNNVWRCNIANRHIARKEEEEAMKKYLDASKNFHKETRVDTKRLKQLERDEEYRTAKLIVETFGILAPVRGGGATAASSREVQKHWAFTMKCPSTACEGFIGLDWKCGMCSANVCPDCREILEGVEGAEGAGNASAAAAATAAEEKHVCNPDTVASVMALNKEAKPCPKCAASISKIDGCDQMWCTQCRTAFSWRTGAIETAVHNPHYYEWKRRNGGLEPTPVGINLVGMAGMAGDGLACIEPHIIVDACVVRPTNVAGFTEACRMIMHARRVIIPNLQLARRTGEETRRVLRIRRLAGEITEAEWTNLLHSQDAKEKKSVRISQVIDLYCNAGIDILRAMAGSDADQNDKHAGELIKLRDYCQQNLLKIKKRFGPVPSLI